MGLKQIENGKSSKGFKPADLIVYGLILALLVALFLAFALRGKQDLSGVEITAENQSVFVYDYQSGNYSLLRDSNSPVPYAEVESGSGEIKVTVHTSNGGINVVEIKKGEPRVRVVEANCKRNDCTYTSLNPTEIVSGNSAPIFCSPHGVIIRPLADPPLTHDVII